jgi:hypothetical protein
MRCTASGLTLIQLVGDARPLNGPAKNAPILRRDRGAQQIGIRGLLHKRAEVHHLVGHRLFLESGWRFATQPHRATSMTTAKPSARYALSRARVRINPATL